jgi:hypothetical protein
MPSSKKVQHFLIKRLDSDIDSVDSDLTYRFKIRSIEVSRVGFDSYFRVGYQVEVFPNSYQDVFQLLGAKKRRRSASNVDRVKRVKSITVHLHLFKEGIQKAGKGGEEC